jgi:hypothetical protein
MGAILRRWGAATLLAKQSKSGPTWSGFDAILSWERRKRRAFAVKKPGIWGFLCSFRHLRALLAGNLIAGSAHRIYSERLCPACSLEE